MWALGTQNYVQDYAHPFLWTSVLLCWCFRLHWVLMLLIINKRLMGVRDNHDYIRTTIPLLKYFTHLTVLLSTEID